MPVHDALLFLMGPATLLLSAAVFYTFLPGTELISKVDNHRPKPLHRKFAHLNLTALPGTDSRTPNQNLV